MFTKMEFNKCPYLSFLIKPSGLILGNLLSVYKYTFVVSSIINIVGSYFQIFLGNFWEKTNPYKLLGLSMTVAALAMVSTDPSMCKY